MWKSNRLANLIKTW